MNSSAFHYNPGLNETAKAILADDRKLAESCLKSELPKNSESTEAWLMKAWTCNSMQETEYAILQALEQDPDSDLATIGLSWIYGIRDLVQQQVDAKLAAEEEARRQAELEAQRKAEEEARLQAELEARLAAEAEARRQAELEAQRKAEEEARLLAERQAQLKAEEEARLEAERQARLKKQAEEQARIKAEEEAKRNEELTLHADLMLQSPTSGDAIAMDESVNDVVVEIQKDLDELTAVSQEIQAPVGTELPTATPVAEVRKELVLAVDDSPTVRKLVSLTLTSAGFEVVTAADGIEALNILSEKLPDIILSDINMPKLNGYKLCSFVKKHERTRAIPVVMLSGKDGVFDKMRGKMNGCDDFISKPFESAELIAKVRENLAAVTVR